MRTPRELYKEYRISSGLQLHQLRVAAVGKLICDSFKEPINTNEVVLACLFHDMGNIVKFDLDTFPEFLQPEGRAYWEQVKSEFGQKYGTEQHAAAEAVAKDIGLSESVVRMIAHSGFAHLPDILTGNSWELKIVKYADLRVAPKSVVSLKERFEDFARRYSEHTVEDAEAFRMGKELEGQIFANAKLKPEDITDTAAASVIEQLWDYPVP